MSDLRVLQPNLYRYACCEHCRAKHQCEPDGSMGHPYPCLDTPACPGNRQLGEPR